MNSYENISLNLPFFVASEYFYLIQSQNEYHKFHLYQRVSICSACYIHCICDNFIPFTKFEIATGFREFTCMYFGVAIF